MQNPPALPMELDPVQQAIDLHATQLARKLLRSDSLDSSAESALSNLLEIVQEEPVDKPKCSVGLAQRSHSDQERHIAGLEAANLSLEASNQSLEAANHHLEAANQSLRRQLTSMSLDNSRLFKHNERMSADQKRRSADVHLEITLPDLGEIQRSDPSQQRNPIPVVLPTALLPQGNIRAAMGQHGGGLDAAKYPLLHIWISRGQVLQAVRECLPRFVDTPPDKEWLLFRGTDGSQVPDTETCQSLSARDTRLLVAWLVPKQQ